MTSDPAFRPDPAAFDASGRPRARGFGLPFDAPTGPLNAITDVDGVSVGTVTLIAGDAVRTGVTAVLPRPPRALLQPVMAGFFALNGNGEMTGTHWIEEAGIFQGPLMLTNTLSVGIVHHATVRWLARRFPEALAGTFWPMPVVAETYDGWLNDVAGLHVTEVDAMAAIDAAAGGPVREGNVGGGTGMIAYEWKGGTGTASRRVAIGEAQYMLGVLVQANHGRRPWFRIAGVPVGRRMPDGAFRSTETGSIIAYVATDAPLIPTQLKRLARRAALGVGRGGTQGGNSSGDIFLAFTTANRQPDTGPDESDGPTLHRLEALANAFIDPLFEAVADGVEEAVVNAMLAADTMTGKAGRRIEAIDHTALRTAMGL